MRAMKSPLLLTLAISGIALQSGLAAVSLVDFNVANGTGSGSYQGTSRSLSSATSSLGRIDFDTSTAFFPPNGQQTLYGGLQAVNSGTGGTFAASSVRFHDNNPTGWPNSPQVFANINDSSGGVSFNNVTMAMVFKKEDFLNHATGPVAFDASSTLSLHMPTGIRPGVAIPWKSVFWCRKVPNIMSPKRSGPRPELAISPSPISMTTAPLGNVGRQ